MPEPRRIGLLTGTFDPVHLGHVAMAQAAQRAFDLDETWVLVNPRPKHKQVVTPFEHRVAMVRLALVGESLIKLDGFGGLDMPTHEWPDFQRFVASHVGIEFYFIVGSDVLEHWERWQDATTMAVEARLLVAQRGTAQRAELDSRLNVQWFESSDQTEVSSGRVRGAVAEGRIPEGLHPGVWAYIRAHGLYGAV